MRVNAQTRDAHRRALLASAAGAFAGEGYEGAAIDRISEAAGLAKGTIYNYFPSKRAIFEEVLRQGCRYASEAAEALPDGASSGERLEAFVNGNLTWAFAEPAVATVLARELTGGSSETRELILDASAPCIDKVCSILREGTDSGELAPPGEEREMAVTFIALANVLMLQAALGGWPRIDELPRAVTTLFLHGVTNQENRGGEHERR
jgi:AcrR family transcriptional regulator